MEPLGARSPGRLVTAAAVAGGLVAGAAGLVLHRQATRLRGRHDAERDELLVLPGDLEHGEIVRPDGSVVRYVDSAPRSALPPVVLLHGITLQWWMWSAVITLLRDDHRVIAWDMRGFGGSTAGRQGATVAAASDDLAALVVELDLRDAVIVGHSMGGMVLGRFAIDHADELDARVAGLVFLSTSARPRDGTLRTGGLARFGAATAVLAESSLGGRYRWPDNDLSVVLLRHAFGERPTARMLDDLRRCQVEARLQSMIDGSRSIAEHDVRAGLASVTMPTVVVVGTLDRLTPALHARVIARSIAGARLVELEGVGHQPMQEDPVAVASVIRSLRRAGSPDGLADRGR